MPPGERPVVATIFPEGPLASGLVPAVSLTVTIEGKAFRDRACFTDGRTEAQRGWGWDKVTQRVGSRTEI